MKLFLIPLLYISLSLQGFGQDMHTSMFYDSPVTVNPANTGMFNGFHRIHMHYRTQWNSIISKPFTNTIASYEHPTDIMGVGGYIMNTRAGIGGLNFLNIMGSGAYEVSIDKSKQHHLVCGLQLGIIYKSINSDKYLYESQYNTKTGLIDESIPSNESFNKSGIVMPDINFGALYRINQLSKLINPTVGFSLFHLTQPKETFQGITNRLKMRMLINAGTRIELSRTFNIAPQLLFMRQTNNNEFNANVIANYKFRKTKQDIYLGIGYRSNDAVMLSIGTSFKEYLIRFCYDINISALNKVSGGYGAFEISLSYVLLKGNSTPSFLQIGN